MNSIYESLPMDSAMDISFMARLMYECREHRREVLEAFGAADEEALLDDIRTGRVAGHPAYEHYLAARILGDTQLSARETMTVLLEREQRK